MTYYKAEDAIGTTLTAGAFVVDRSHKIVTVGNTSFTAIGASANTVDVVFTATGVGSGTGTAQFIPWILGTEFETILYAACTVGATFLGDVEMEQKFNELTTNKVNSLNQKELRASLKGGSFSAQFSTPLL